MPFTVPPNSMTLGAHTTAERTEVDDHHRARAACVETCAPAGGRRSSDEPSDASGTHQQRAHRARERKAAKRHPVNAGVSATGCAVGVVTTSGATTVHDGAVARTIGSQPRCSPCTACAVP